jgi:hypothetical protein
LGTPRRDIGRLYMNNQHSWARTVDTPNLSSSLH